MRRITVDKSVRYNPKSEKKHEKIKNKVNQFNLFQEEVNQTRENKTKNYHKTTRNGLLADLEYLKSTMYMYKKFSIIIRI